MTARPVRIRPWMADGPGAEITAWPTPVPGLVIHASIAEPGWTITMQRGGVAAACGLADPETALACAVELGPLADWTQPVDLDAIRGAGLAIVNRYGRSRPPVPAARWQLRAIGAIR